MRPVNFEGSNMILSKPNNMTDEQCESVPAYYGTAPDGFPFYLVAFQPNYEDLKELNNGGFVFLKIVANKFPPSALLTITDGKVNEEL